jgi:hypothetical protein
VKTRISSLSSFADSGCVNWNSSSMDDLDNVQDQGIVFQIKIQAVKIKLPTLAEIIKM